MRPENKGNYFAPKPEEPKVEKVTKVEDAKMEENPKEFVCPICGKKFTSEKSLRMHSIRAHKQA